LQLLTDQFIDGFVQAKDKMSYLRLAGVPLERPGRDGGPSMKLVDVRLTTEWQVGTASPSFGSRELSWLPFPGEMITERTNMGLVYVSLDAKEVHDIRHFLAHAGGVGVARRGLGLGDVADVEHGLRGQELEHPPGLRLVLGTATSARGGHAPAPRPRPSGAAPAGPPPCRRP
jgi:hypothetical protein